MEKPNILMKANVPISETGMVTAGMMVARQSSRNKKITMITMMIASSSVVTTSLTESPTTVVVSKAIDVLDSRRKGLAKVPASAALAALSTSSALASESCCTPMPMASWPLYIRLVS